MAEVTLEDLLRKYEEAAHILNELLNQPSVSRDDSVLLLQISDAMRAVDGLWEELQSE